MIMKSEPFIWRGMHLNVANVAKKGRNGCGLWTHDNLIIYENHILCHLKQFHVTQFSDKIIFVELGMTVQINVFFSSIILTDHLTDNYQTVPDFFYIFSHPERSWGPVRKYYFKVSKVRKKPSSLHHNQ